MGVACPAAIHVALWVLLALIADALPPLARIRARFRDMPRQAPRMPMATTARFSGTSLNRCVRIGMSDQGLFIRFAFPFGFRRPLTFIPVAEIRDPVPRLWLGLDLLEFSVCDPPIATIRVPAEAFLGSTHASKPS